MYNELKKMCIGCEGIMYGERDDAYAFMCVFLLANSPGRTPEEVHVVAGDGFFNQIVINEFGSPNAKFVSDWFHSFKTGLTDRFGDHGCSLIEG